MNSLTIIVSFFLILTVSSMAIYETVAAENPEIVAKEMANGLFGQSDFFLFFKLANPSQNTPKSRIQRSSHKTCGQKIVDYTRKICDSLDTYTNSQLDISTKCCSEKCTDDFIKKAMCPDKQ
ncbi:hypothetical protein CRE_11794 [Caenorhabditis remanei]|uniref:Uncharacterized protein n=1 Tax=Caenorhabditis remanei TaxID=31234 RepID=E3M4Q3_CAERE|nr:hypothetical protein CRE_11794 [Caenorhabditis remanei]